MVSLIGFKLKLGTLSMGLLFVTSLALLLSEGRIARIGRIVAGFCLLFIGLDMMQDGMGDAADWLRPNRLPDGLAGAIFMAGLGLAITVAMQSSSAAVAVVLVFLANDTLSLIQAAAAVIGMNVGTTFTSLLAALGGSRAMQQTAVANLLFNLGTTALAFPLLWGLSGGLQTIALHVGADTALVFFHTAFNLLGTMVFLPLTAPFSNAVERLLPEPATDRAPTLDTRLLTDEGSAMQAAHSVVFWAAQQLFTAYANALGPRHDLRALSALTPKLTPVLEDLKTYLAQITMPRDKPTEATAYAALMHQVDHLDRLLAQSGKRRFIPALHRHPITARPALWFAACLAPRKGLTLAQTGHHMARMAPIMAKRMHRHRRGLLLGEHVGLYSVQDTFEITDAMRWLLRIIHNVQRLGEYDATINQALGRAKAPTPDHSLLQAGVQRSDNGIAHFRG
jgi:phosphate:Na+ symporter